jgi:cytochrome c oxidase subunit II
MTNRPARIAAKAMAVATGLGACAGPQSSLDPRGPDAVRIAQLWWVMFGVAAAVSLAVTVLLLVAVSRSMQRSDGRSVPEVNGRALVWVGGVIVPVLILFPVLFFSYRVGTEVYPPPSGTAEAAVTIEVVGHMFWWEVRYPEYGITTANEIHIPVGQRVRFLVTSPDVIHSFWIPQLHGKIDMVPGRHTTLWVRADEPGEMRGQCAEYCGMGHALMAFWVVAVPADEFARWVARRTAPAIEPPDPQVGLGRDVFFAAGCGHCHATRGEPLPADLGAPGPDLTDLATRRTIAAGTLPNTRAGLAEFIENPDRIKPGSRMPATRLPVAEREALLTYLESLR